MEKSVTNGKLTLQLSSTAFIQIFKKEKPESPLDLTIKPIINFLPSMNNKSASCLKSPIKKRYRDDVECKILTVQTNTDNIDADEKINLSPLKKRYRDNGDDLQKSISNNNNNNKNAKAQELKNETTPKKAIITASTASNPAVKKCPKNVVKEKKSKAIRKLKFDEYRSSPVSGTIIRSIEEVNENDIASGDIDPIYNVVEVTDEAKAELAQIENVIGAYVCKLCTIEFEDAFGLARHRCNCIVLLEYRCPECGKKFNCPANLGNEKLLFIRV
jgi:hypothetical protein